MFCAKCGTPNEDNSKFCCGCGEPLVQNAEPVQAPQGFATGNPAPEYTQQAYNYQQPPVNMPYKAPIASRSIATCLILTIVTCGFYGIYWLIKLVDDLNTAAQTTEESSGITVFLLGLVTCGIYIFYWYYKAGDKVNKIKALSGQPAGEASILYLLLGVFGLGIVNYVLIQSELNKVAAEQ